MSTLPLYDARVMELCIVSARCETPGTVFFDATAHTFLFMMPLYRVYQKGSDKQMLHFCMQVSVPWLI